MSGSPDTGCTCHGGGFLRIDRCSFHTRLSRCTGLKRHAARAVTFPDCLSPSLQRLKKEADRQMDATDSGPVSAPVDQLEITNCCAVIICR